MYSKRHSLPLNFEHCNAVDFLVAFADFEVLKGLKQLPFDHGDYSCVLPRVVRGLEQFAPPPLALPESWLGDALHRNSSSTRSPYFHEGIANREAKLSSESLPASSSHVGGLQFESVPPPTVVPITPPPHILATLPPNIPIKSLRRRAESSTTASSSSASESSTSSQSVAEPVPPPVDSPQEEEGPVVLESPTEQGGPVILESPNVQEDQDPVMVEEGPKEKQDIIISRPEKPRRQLSGVFIRGQRLPFAIEEEDEDVSSASCYSTEEAAAESQSQTEPAAVEAAVPVEERGGSGIRSRASSISPSECSKDRPCSTVPSKQRRTRGRFLKERMKRMLDIKTFRARLRGQIA